MIKDVPERTGENSGAADLPELADVREARLRVEPLQHREDVLQEYALALRQFGLSRHVKSILFIEKT